MTSPSFRQFRRTIYEIKRKFPTSIQLCRTTDDVTDYATGAKSYTLVTTTIKRVAVMNSKDVRKFMHVNADISHKQDFAMGGYFDTRTRAVVISQRDIPADYPIDLNMFALFNGQRLEVKGMEESESNEYLVLTVQELDGSVLPPVPTPPTIPASIVAPNAVATIVYLPTGGTLDAGSSGKVFSTIGATADAAFNLPAWSEGLQYTFHVGSAFDLRVIAHGTDIIVDGGSSSVPGGNVESNQQDAVIQFTAIAPGTWTATFAVRFWAAN